MNQTKEKILKEKLEYLKIKLENKIQILQALNYKKTLERGFSLVQTQEGKLVSSSSTLFDKDSFWNIIFSDGGVKVSPFKKELKTKAAKSSKGEKNNQNNNQEILF